jgi:predicted amidophosphoribosyltransferase
MLDLSRLDPQPAGFAGCRRCAYRDVSRATPIKGGAVAPPWAVCYACVMQNVRRLSDDRCEACGQEIDDEGECPNYVCGWPSRGYTWVRPVAQRHGALKTAINRYKYEGYTGYALIFGRTLDGFMDEHEDVFRQFDMVISSPTYTGEGGRDFDHTWEVLAAADAESFSDWPFEKDVIIKTAATERFVGKRWPQRRAIAEGPLRAALRVPDPSRVQGKKVLVYDDVFTDGFTIREVANKLRDAGATEVCEIVLARQPRGS